MDQTRSTMLTGAAPDRLHTQSHSVQYSVGGWNMRKAERLTTICSVTLTPLSSQVVAQKASNLANLASLTADVDVE